MFLVFAVAKEASICDPSAARWKPEGGHQETKVLREVGTHFIYLRGMLSMLLFILSLANHFLLLQKYAATVGLWLDLGFMGGA